MLRITKVTFIISIGPEVSNLRKRIEMWQLMMAIMPKMDGM